MKKIIISVFLVFLAMPVFSEPLLDAPLTETSQTFEAGITFDWITKTQLQRDENIAKIQNILFTQDTALKINKKEFEKTYSNFWKNPNFTKDYEEISQGKKEDDEKNYCGFYVGKLLVAYGIQYKNNLKNIYYYDAMGNLRWVDVFSSSYPNFPYWSYQYYRNGELIAAYYYVSNYDQYVFDPDKKFRGRWFKDKLYNRKAKVVMTRTNY